LELSLRELFAPVYRWLLIYGRRKTGKTFYVREKGEYDRYLIVTRNKTLIDIVAQDVFEFPPWYNGHY